MELTPDEQQRVDEIVEPLSDEERERIFRPNAGNGDSIPPDVSNMIHTMTDIMGSNAFGEFIDVSAKVAVRFYNKLLEEGMPADIAAGCVSQYCSNLSNGGANGNS